ncbi:MAG: glycosyltransferase [Bacteroidia bacterium]|nr:glycosyltransferase [Bacteroidia bacterium]
MSKPTVLILGKIPPPYYGTSVSMLLIMQSALHQNYTLIPINTNVHTSLDTLGKISFNKFKLNLMMYVQLYKTIKKKHPQCAVIPISQTTIGFVKDAMFIWICRAMGVKVLVHLHGSVLLDWYNKSNFITRKITYATLTKTQGAIVLGTNLKYIFEPFLSTKKIHVVPNGANYTYTHTTKINNQLQVLYLGNLQATKGIIDVIDALVLLKNKYVIPFECTIIGAWRDEATKAQCLKLVTDNTLNVQFKGIVTGPDKNKYYEQANVFVFTPRAPEGHPWVIVEAMAAGLPIISTNKGAIKESVIDNHNGFIVDDNAPQQIAERLYQLAITPNLITTMSANALAHYNNNFTETKMVNQLHTAIDNVLKA